MDTFYRSWYILGGEIINPLIPSLEGVENNVLTIEELLKKVEMVNKMNPVYEKSIIIDSININSLYGDSGRWRMLMEEKFFEEFISKNNINVKENGDFECYIIVDQTDTENVPGTIFNNMDIKAYPYETAYKNLNYNFSKVKYTNPHTFSHISHMLRRDCIQSQDILSIKESILQMNKKIIRVLVNRNNITGVLPIEFYGIWINKYKVIEEVILEPKIAIKNLYFHNDENNLVSVTLYNTITDYEVSICIKSSEDDTDESIKDKIKKYIELDETQTWIKKSLREHILI